jgi:hypothetical protein
MFNLLAGRFAPLKINKRLKVKEETLKYDGELHFEADDIFKEFLLKLKFEDFSHEYKEGKFCYKLYPRRQVTGKTVVFDYINIRLQYGSAIMVQTPYLDLRTFCIFLTAKDPSEFRLLLENWEA